MARRSSRPSRAPDQAFGFRIETRKRLIPLQDTEVSFPVTVQYARPVSELESTVRGLRASLLAGVLAGTLLALVGGVLLARRALRPITDLTAAARTIEQTRDPELRVPQPGTDDEVAELAGTLQGMLDALASSRAETEDSLMRQRQFVADASHELRTPLTAVLANLELLADVLDGDAARRRAARCAPRGG
jgi:signal transduction histidine kinase